MGNLRKEDGNGDFILSFDMQRRKKTTVDLKHLGDILSQHDDEESDTMRSDLNEEGGVNPVCFLP